MINTEKKKMDVSVPAFVIHETKETPGKSQKRCIIMAVTSVVVAALVLTTILVGVYIFTEAEKDIVKVVLQLRNNMTQEVLSNPNMNIVQYHVMELNQETWTVNDYNFDLKVIKIRSATGTNCYVTPLNESSPVNIQNMESFDGMTKPAAAVPVSYSTNGSPIKDTSFLGKTARDMCSGVSTYWLYPRCSSATDKNLQNTTSFLNERRKRSSFIHMTSCDSSFYVSYANFTYSCARECDNTCSSGGGSSPPCRFRWWFSPECSWCIMYQCTNYYHDLLGLVHVLGCVITL